MNVKMVVHCRRAAFDVLIDRTTKWGNPFSHVRGKYTRAQYVVATRQKAIECYEAWLLQQPELLAQLVELEGKVLGCWCDPLPCHGHVLVRRANKGLVIV